MRREALTQASAMHADVKHRNFCCEHAVLM
jgi:hypothetical protein